MADGSRVRVQMVDGRHLEERGTLEDVGSRLSPVACGPHIRGDAVLPNRDHVLYRERRGQSRTAGLVR